MARLPRPVAPPPVPPGTVPFDRRISFKQLLDKPTTLDEAGLSGPTAPPSTGPLELHADGRPPLILQRNEVAPGVLPVVTLKRAGVVLGYVGFDANDHVVVLAKDGTTVVGEFGTGSAMTFSLALHNPAGAAGVTPFLCLQRAGSVIGYLGSDASDRLAFIASDGTTVLAFLTGAGELNVLLRVKTPKILDAAGHQVVGAQQPAIADASASGAAGDTSAGSGTGAAANPPTQAEFNALVGVVNANAGSSNNNGAAITALVATVNALITSHNTLLAELRASTGHGLIA